MTYTIGIDHSDVTGRLALDGSKSISNRLLVLRALCREEFPISRLSTSADTQRLSELLHSEAEVLDAGDAGTTYRFLTAYLALTTMRSRVLTGSPRMLQRPVAPLVEALRKLGARIEYMEQEGFPPLLFHPPTINDLTSIAISAGASSQFVSAILLVAPTLPNGLELVLQGSVVSMPYISMTLKLMETFGIPCRWEADRIQVEPAPYKGRPFEVEADWSAAAFYYSIVALAQSGEICLEGLSEESLQGDAVLAKMMEQFGVVTKFEPGGIRISRPERVSPSFFQWDFLPCPDLVQPVALTCAALGVPGMFTGLDTLRLKETDRILALQNELARVGVQATNLPSRTPGQSAGAFLSIRGQSKIEDRPRFRTYGDHRMAMSLTAFALLGDIQIEEPGVVVKSYPQFWDHLRQLGFRIIEEK